MKLAELESQLEALWLAGYIYWRVTVENPDNMNRRYIFKDFNGCTNDLDTGYSLILDVEHNGDFVIDFRLCPQGHITDIARYCRSLLVLQDIVAALNA